MPLEVADADVDGGPQRRCGERRRRRREREPGQERLHAPRGRGHAPVRRLAGGLEEQDARGHADVEALDGRAHRAPRRAGRRARSRRPAGRRPRARPRARAARAGPPRRRACRRTAAAAITTPRAASRRRASSSGSAPHVRQAEGAAHRAAQGLPGERIGAAVREVRTGRARGLGRAQEAAEVARVLHARRDEHERHAAIERLLVERRPARRSRGRPGSSPSPTATPARPRRTHRTGTGTSGTAASRAPPRPRRSRCPPRPLPRAASAPRRAPGPRPRATSARAGGRPGDCCGSSRPRRRVSFGSGAPGTAARAVILSPGRQAGRSGGPGAPCRGSGTYFFQDDAMIAIKKRLEDEMKALDYELKVELPKEILRAREYGDLRENAEYKAAKERQTFLQVRISQLQRRVAALSMMNLDRIPKDKVGLGSFGDPARDRRRHDRVRDRDARGGRSHRRPHLAVVADRQVPAEPRSGRHRRGEGARRARASTRSSSSSPSTTRTRRPRAEDVAVTAPALTTVALGDDVAAALRSAPRGRRRRPDRRPRRTQPPDREGREPAPLGRDALRSRPAAQAGRAAAHEPHAASRWRSRSPRPRPTSASACATSA